MRTRAKLALRIAAIVVALSPLWLHIPPQTRWLAAAHLRIAQHELWRGSEFGCGTCAAYDTGPTLDVEADGSPILDLYLARNAQDAHRVALGVARTRTCDPLLLAAAIRTGLGVLCIRSAGQEVALPATRENVHASKELLELTLIAAALEPDNAFFPAASAVAYHVLGEVEARDRALSRAVALERYDDYYAKHSALQLRRVESQTGYAGEEARWLASEAVGWLRARAFKALALDLRKEQDALKARRSLAVVAVRGLSSSAEALDIVIAHQTFLLACGHEFDNGTSTDRTAERERETVRAFAASLDGTDPAAWLRAHGRLNAWRQEMQSRDWPAPPWQELHAGNVYLRALLAAVGFLCVAWLFGRLLRHQWPREGAPALFAGVVAAAMVLVPPDEGDTLFLSFPAAGFLLSAALAGRASARGVSVGVAWATSVATVVAAPLAGDVLEFAVIPVLLFAMTFWRNEWLRRRETQGLMLVAPAVILGLFVLLWSVAPPASATQAVAWVLAAGLAVSAWQRVSLGDAFAQAANAGPAVLLLAGGVFLAAFFHGYRMDAEFGEATAAEALSVRAVAAEASTLAGDLALRSTGRDEVQPVPSGPSTETRITSN